MPNQTVTITTWRGETFTMDFDGPVSVSVGEDKPAPPQARPVNIEEGKFYRTRDGKKVGPLKQRVGTDGSAFIFSWACQSVNLRGEKQERIWSSGGRFFSDNYDHRLDLISEWVDEQQSPAPPFAIGEIVKWTHDGRNSVYGCVTGYDRERDRVLLKRLTLFNDRAALPKEILTLDLRTVAGGGWRTLEIGKTYADRDGAQRRVVEESTRRCVSETGGVYYKNGRYMATFLPSRYDLVAEVRP